MVERLYPRPVMQGELMRKRGYGVRGFAQFGVRGRSTTLVLILASCLPGTARALTLNEALLSAYRFNPVLDGQRAALRAVDEQAAIARAGGRPQFSLGGSYTQGVQGLRDLEGYNRAIIAGVTANLPIYQGGRVANAVRAADQRSEGGRSELAATEGDVLLQAAISYLDVLTNQRALEINRQNQAAVEKIVASTLARFHAGDVTRTDVSQSLARAERSKLGLVAAEGSLKISEDTFKRIIGTEPVDLIEPAALKDLPETADRAADIALAQSPVLGTMKAAVKAAHYDVNSAKATRLPTVSVSAASNYYAYKDRFAGIGDVTSNATQAGLSVTIPLYQGGAASAEIRSARDRVDQAIDQQAAAEAQVEAGARAAFINYDTARKQVSASEEAVVDDSEALHGVQIEAEAGERQVVDVLNAQLELLSSRLDLERARHASAVAGLQLLNAMGLMSLANLGIVADKPYDPMANYRHAIRTLDDYSGRPLPMRGRYGPAPTAE